MYKPARLFFLALSNTGCRQDEISQTNIEDFDAAMGTLRVIRKGCKQDIVFLNDTIKDLTEKSLQLRKEQYDLTPKMPLFLNRYGNRLQDINESIAAACERTSVPT
jgi:integrase